MLYERQGARARARPRGARNSVATPPSPPLPFTCLLLLPRKIYRQTRILDSKNCFEVISFFLNFDVCVFFLFFFLFAPVLSLELKFVNGFAILSDIYCLIDNLDFSSRD